MSENNQQNKINILTENQGVAQQNTWEDNTHAQSDLQNHLTLPQQPKHTIQDDITEFSQAIQKKRNSQRKSVFSNHEEMNLGDLINKDSQEQEKDDGQSQIHSNNSPQIVNQVEAGLNNQQQDSNENNAQQSEQSNSNTQFLLPVKPQHNVQDDIKEFNEHIVQRKNVRRASRFQEENQSHLQELASHLQDNANKLHAENENNEQRKKEAQNEEGEEEKDHNQITSLNELQDKENKLQQGRDDDNKEFLKSNDENTKQKSISELQEEAKQKPNALNEVIKLTSQIQVKRDLKRKSTFSMTNIKHEDEEEEEGNQQDNKQQKSNEQTEQQQQQHLKQSPGKEKKQNALNEIIKLNNEIHFKSSLKRKSTFSLPTIQDDDDNNDNNEESKEKPKSIKLIDEKEISKIKEQPSIEERGDNEDGESHQQNNDSEQGGEQHQHHTGKKPNALVEILKLNSDIQVKRQLTRKSTFSLPVHLDDEEDGNNKENQENQENNDNDLQSQPSSTSLQQNMNENAERNAADIPDSQENSSDQQKKPSAYQEIVTLNNQINSKRSLTRKSTFSVPLIPEGEEADSSEKKDDNSKITEESHHLDDTQEITKKKPNALNEIIELNNEIQHKKDLRRKSTFSIPVILDDDLDLKKEEGEGQQKQSQQEGAQKKKNALDDILELSDQIQVKRNSRRKSTFSKINNAQQQEEQQDNKKKVVLENDEAEDQLHEGVAEDETAEAKLQRQRKKKNLKDKEEADHRVKNAHGSQSQQKKHIFLEENKHNFRKVIHPTIKPEQTENKDNKDNQEEQVEEVNNLQSYNNQKQVDEDNQKANQDIDINLNLHRSDIQNSQKTSQQQSPDIYQDKKSKNERRDEFALQRKLEYLTAKSAKNELIRKEKGNIPHNKFIAQELSKEIKIREANKRKRELETMLAQINREIQNIRNSDPDYESLAINNVHQKSVQDENNRSQSNHLYSSNMENQKNSGRILPPIKKNNQIKEMIKIAEDSVANQNAVSIIQKYKKEKEFKRQKKEQEFQQVSNQIYKEVELRRQQNESLHEKIILEKRQKLLHKKQQYESKKAEQQQLLVASKMFVKELHQVGPGKATNNYLSQVNQIDSEYKFGPYQTPELDAQKLGLQQIRSLQKGEQVEGVPLPNFMKNKNNNEFKKLLEENKINRDREIKIIENRKDLYKQNKEFFMSDVLNFPHFYKNSKRMEYSKSVKNNLLRGGRKLDISSNLLFQDEGLNKNRLVVSSSVTNLEKKKKLQQELENANLQSEQDENKQTQEQEFIDIPQSQSTKSVNNKVWRVIKH